MKVKITIAFEVDDEQTLDKWLDNPKLSSLAWIVGKDWFIDRVERGKWTELVNN